VPPIEAAQTRIQSLVALIVEVEPALKIQRLDLVTAEAALGAADARADEIGRRMFVRSAAALPSAIDPPPGWIAEFGIEAGQRRSRELAKAADEEKAAREWVAGARRTVRESEALLARYRRDLTTQQRTLANLKRQAAERARAAAAGRPGSSAGYPGGRLLRPTAGPLTSPFGDRFDPYYRVHQLHAGIDIAAGQGAPIRAAASGWVVQAGDHGGYGKYTCLSHGMVRGQRMMTCYGHQSKIGVRPGRQVRRGELIGLVGATGAATGPHLHFEVRLDGRAVDPMPWLA
jgi:murein DD-endopeptidase MepM/ murein hydrolase activator NlpD